MELILKKRYGFYVFDYDWFEHHGAKNHSKTYWYNTPEEAITAHRYSKKYDRHWEGDHIQETHRIKTEWTYIEPEPKQFKHGLALKYNHKPTPPELQREARIKLEAEYKAKSKAALDLKDKEYWNYKAIDVCFDLDLVSEKDFPVIGHDGEIERIIKMAPNSLLKHWYEHFEDLKFDDDYAYYWHDVNNIDVLKKREEIFVQNHPDQPLFDLAADYIDF